MPKLNKTEDRRWWGAYDRAFFTLLLGHNGTKLKPEGLAHLAIDYATAYLHEGLRARRGR